MVKFNNRAGWNNRAGRHFWVVNRAGGTNILEVVVKVVHTHKHTRTISCCSTHTHTDILEVVVVVVHTETY